MESSISQINLALLFFVIWCITGCAFEIVSRHWATILFNAIAMVRNVSANQMPAAAGQICKKNESLRKIIQWLKELLLTLISHTELKSRCHMNEWTL